MFRLTWTCQACIISGAQRALQLWPLLQLGRQPDQHQDICAFVQRPRQAYATELAAFHTPDYINFLATTTPHNQEEQAQQLLQFNMGEDCPIFEGLFDFCRLYAGASIEAAVKINHGLCDIAINWSGGLHHAKKGEASGQRIVLKGQ